MQHLGTTDWVHALVKTTIPGISKSLAINGYIVNVVAIQSSGGEICKAYFASFCFLKFIYLAYLRLRQARSIAQVQGLAYYSALYSSLFVRFDNVVYGVISSMLAAVHAWWQNEQCRCQIILHRKSTTSTCESAYVMLNHTANIKQC